MDRHEYVSTACQHDLHDRCRKVCKFCPAPCGCTCHQEVIQTEETTVAARRGCGCSCHGPLGMSVRHAVPCCDEPPVFTTGKTGDR